MQSNQTALFEKLSASSFRSKFHLQPKDVDYISDKGLTEIAAHAHKFIAQRLAPAEPHRDGKQTPYRGHPVFIAQHATATCCRTCLMKWHKIPKAVELSQAQQDYVVEVILTWLRAESEKCGFSRL